MEVGEGFQGEVACYVATGKSPRRLFPAICTQAVTWLGREDIQELTSGWSLFDCCGLGMYRLVTLCDVHAGCVLGPSVVVSRTCFPEPESIDFRVYAQEESELPVKLKSWVKKDVRLDAIHLRKLLLERI